MKSPVIAIALVFLLAASLLGAARPAFNVNYNYDIGQGARDILTIDLNGDGRADIATANQLSNDISTFISSHDGTLFFLVNHPVSGGPIALAGGDFDADGDNDIAALCDNGTIRILLNKGNGRLETGPIVNAGAEPTDIVAANLDGDQYCDLGVTVRTIDSVLIFHGDAGAAMAVRTPCFAANLPTGVAIGDIDGDGDLDLHVVGYGPKSQTVLYNDGTGVFSIFESRDWHEPSFFTAVGDLTADGYPEVVTLDPCFGPEGDIYAYFYRINYNLPEGPIPPNVYEYVSSWSVGICSSLDIQDIDVNGAGDVILVRSDLAIVGICYSDFSFPRPTDNKYWFLDWTSSLGSPRPYPVDGVPGFTTAADLDGDGYPELLSLLQDRDQLVVMPNFIMGDLDGDRAVNLSDITRMIAFVYLNGYAPIPVQRANVDGSADGKVNLSDITYLVAYVYLHGAAPVE